MLSQHTTNTQLIDNMNNPIAGKRELVSFVKEFGRILLRNHLD